MKNLFTLFAFSLINTLLFAQTCPTSASMIDINGNFKLLLQYDSEALSDAVADRDGTGCDNNNNCYGISAMNISGSIDGTAHTINTTNLSNLKDHGAIDGGLRIDGQNGTAAGAFTGTVIFTPTGGGGDISCTFDGGALPVELISFTAKADDNLVSLTWKTASELNNDYFVIERSADGRNFEEVSKEVGVGTSATLNEYNAVDNNPFTGANYYRLRQVDFDGTEDYSDIVQVNFRTDKNVGELTVFPTLVQNTNLLHIDLTENNANIIAFSIFDLNGKLVSSIELQGGDVAAFSIDNLQNGMYFIRDGSNENNLSTRFIIAR